MADRFDTFTDAAKRVLVLSQLEAQGLRHHYIGTAHFLLGLLAENKSLAAHALHDCGVDLVPARLAVEAMSGRGELPHLGEMGLTPRAKQVIELAVTEAEARRQDFIGPEHLLLGLLREGRGGAVSIMGNSGTSIEAVRARLDLKMPPIVEAS